MANPHLKHLIPWQVLSDLLLLNEDSGLTAPVGECNKIHIERKREEIQVEHRKYLENHICNSTTCPTKGTMIFYKRKKLKLTIDKETRSLTQSKCKSLEYFVEKFVQAVNEFAETEMKKVNVDLADQTAGNNEIIIKNLEERFPQRSFRGLWQDILYELIAHGELETILLLDKRKIIDIRQLLGENYGGQAVGNGFRFLIANHLLPCYFVSNLIISNNLENTPEMWGHMKTEGNVRKFLNYDCDGRTFIVNLRPFVQPQKYMIDIAGTSEMIKQIFSAIYIYYLLCKLSNFKADLKGDLYIIFRDFFGFTAISEQLFFGNFKDFVNSLPIDDVYCS